MMPLLEIKMKSSNFGGINEPDQLTGIAAQTHDSGIQLGLWQSGPGVLDLLFKWTETVYILEGNAEVTNLQTLESFTLEPGMMLLFEAGSHWSWKIPWKLKKIFTLVDN